MIEVNLKHPELVGKENYAGGLFGGTPFSESLYKKAIIWIEAKGLDNKIYLLWYLRKDQQQLLNYIRSLQNINNCNNDAKNTNKTLNPTKMPVESNKRKAELIREFITLTETIDGKALEKLNLNQLTKIVELQREINQFIQGTKTS